MSLATRSLSAAEVDSLQALARRHGVHRVRIFGSVARGEGGPESDLDLLIALERGRGFRDLMDFCEEAESVLRRRIDVVLEDALSPYIRDRVLREALAL